MTAGPGDSSFTHTGGTTGMADNKKKPEPRKLDETVAGGKYQREEGGPFVNSESEPLADEHQPPEHRKQQPPATPPATPPGGGNGSTT